MKTVVLAEVRTIPQAEWEEKFCGPLPEEADKIRGHSARRFGQVQTFPSGMELQPKRLVSRYCGPPRRAGVRAFSVEVHESASPYL